MKFYGDISEEDKKFANELEELEGVVDNSTTMSNRMKSKLFTCLAHDYIKDLSMEEEAFRLLEKAEKLTPGYFKDNQKEDMAEDSKYAFLVKDLAQSLISLGSSFLTERAK